MKKTKATKLKLNRDTFRLLSREAIEQVKGGLWPTATALAGGCSVGGYTCTCFCV